MQRPSRTRVGLILSVAAGLAASSFVFGSLTSTSSLADGPVDRSVQFVAEQDAFGSSSSPNLRRAAMDRLVARNAAGVRKVSYLKFTVTREALGTGDVVGAKLLVSPRESMGVPIELRRVSRNDWSEQSLTYNNAPAVGAVLGQVSPGPATTRWIDVSRVVTSPGTYSFALTAERGIGRFSSAETHRPPTLIVRVKQPGSGTSTPTPTTPEPTPTVSDTPTPTTPEPTPTVSDTPTTSKTPTPDPTGQPGGCRARFPGDPCAGTMYYGASVEGGDPRTLESQLGQGLALYRSYMQASTPASKLASRAATDVAAGRIPLISTKVPNNDWAGVAAGQQDAWLLDRIRALAAVKGPVWLCLHHEPRGDGDPADWVAMQQHARTLIDANSTNIALVGILNGWDFLDRNGHPEAYNHPLGTGVDIMGFDNYNPWSPTNGMDWKPAATAMSPGAAISSWGYPTLVGEMGVRTDPSNPGRAAQWLAEAYDYAVGHGFVGVSYFDSGANSPDGTWDLTGERLTQYGKNLARPETAHLTR